jgi:hypothetical protein
MSAFHLFQRVRYARNILGCNSAAKVGDEGVIVAFTAPHELHIEVLLDRLKETRFFNESELEPAKYLPDAADFVTTERVYEPDCPVRNPAVSAEGVA